MELTHDQKQALFTDGSVHLPGIVPRRLVDAALRAINASLGDRGMAPDDLPTLRARSYAPEVQGAAAITDLLTGSGLWSAAESAIGAGKIRPVRAGQIALRFPSMDPARAPHPHIDGMYTPTNGVPKGEIRNFTALVGVFLSDVPTDDAGNFTVWPGTHRLNEDYFRREGPEALLNGMPQVDLPPPKEVERELRLTAPRDEAVAVPKARHVRDVLRDGQALEQAELLVHERQAVRTRLRRRDAVRKDVVAEPDRARRRLVHPCEDLDQRALAGAVLAEQRDDLAGTHT